MAAVMASTVPPSAASTTADGPRRGPRSTKASAAAAAAASDSAKSGGKRGRPRVEGQDQSAAERRRTQIRLAQRAYRERKETTIAELETKVAQMQASLQQARDLLSGFQSLATKAHIAAWDASVSQALDETVAKVNRITNDLPSEPSEAQMSESLKRKRAHSTDPARPARNHNSAVVHREDWLSSIQVPHHAIPAMLGYTWTFDDDATEEIEESLPLVHEDWPSGPEDLHDPKELVSLVNPPLQVGATFTNNWMPTLGRELQPYHTFHLPESSWARRFHRFCYEHAYALLTNPRVAPGLLHHKMRYSLCFGSIRRIAERLKWKLMRADHEPMEMWDGPALHIGNSGYNFPRDGVDDSRPPPQGFAARYNTGPFQWNGATRPPASVYPYQVAQWLGIEGTWLDGYDLEQYLRTKGLHLDGWSPVVTIEVDDQGRPTHSPSEMSSPNGASTSSYSGPQSPSTITADGGAAGFFPAIVDPVSESGLVNGNLGFDVSTEDSMNFQNAAPKFEINMQTPVNPNLPQQTAPPTRFPPPSGKKIIIDVDRLMREFYKNTICLGRSPGIKIDQVDAALHHVILESMDSQ